MNSNWPNAPKPISGVLLDITGVLYESGDGDGTVIEGSVHAFNRLKASGIPVRLVTNETSAPKEALLTKLRRHGYTLSPEEVFSPIPAVCALMRQRGDRPHLLVHPNVKSEFAEFSQGDPTCVVVGDADENFTYANVNAAFNVLMGDKSRRLYSLGMGRFYKHKGCLQLDLGAYTAALEFASDRKAEIVGKPSLGYFTSALNDMGITPDQAVMVGDDINSDVGGAQICGMRGVLVRTGKYTAANEDHPTVTPHFIADNLAQAVEVMAQRLGWP